MNYMTAEEFKELKTSETPFIEALNMVYAKSIIDKKEKALKEFFHTPFGSYLHLVSHNIDEINQNIEDMKMIKGMLEDLNPGIRKLDRENEQSSKIIRYHYENFFLRIGKVKDLFLILINQVMMLEFKKNLKMEKLILKRLKPFHPNFENIWKYVTDQLNPLKPYRNHLAHNGTLKHEDLTLLDVYYKYEIKHKNIIEEFRHELDMSQIQRELIEKFTAVIESYLLNIDQLQKMIFLFLGPPFLDRLKGLAAK